MSDLPFVTIIMPIRNEVAYITRSLRSVLAQCYPSDHLEIIVADGMSTDGSREIVRSLQAKYCNLLMIDNLRKIVPTGINAALVLANGEVIIRVDGHCEIARDYVRRCIEHLRNENVDAVGGPIMTVGETTIAKAIALAMASQFGVGGSAFRTVRNRSMLTDTIAFPAYRRTIIEQAGPFDEEFVRNQDDEYNYRLRRIGAKILLAADVHSRYYSRSSFQSLWRQYFWYGYWKVRVMQKHPHQMRPRQFVPPAFVAAIISAIVCSCFFPIGQALLKLIIGVYTLANLVASIATVRKGGWLYLLFLPFVFATLHLSYGLGFLCGFLKFWNRWRDA